jgi:SAM-dependent methyltransferase
VSATPEATATAAEQPRPRVPEGIDTSVPNVARIYDYLLDGKDNFEADRQAAHHLVTLVPAVRQSVWENRRLLRRAIRYLAADEGIDQFLDIGVGLPTQGAVHEVAHETNPAARVAYVDYDPVVVLHGNALLTEPDRSVVVQADVRQPELIFGDPVISAHLDFSRPVAVTLLAVMHFVSDEDDPYGIVAAVRDALAPGSFLVLGHVSRDNVPDDLAERVVKMYEQASEPLTPRSKDQVTRFFGGFQLVEPGITHENGWRPDADTPLANQASLGWAGVGRKR